MFAEKPLGDDHYSSSTVSCKKMLRLHKRTFVVVVSRRRAFLKIRKLIRLIKKLVTSKISVSWLQFYVMTITFFSPIIFFFYKNRKHISHWFLWEDLGNTRNIHITMILFVWVCLCRVFFVGFFFFFNSIGCTTDDLLISSLGTCLLFSDNTGVN